MTIPILHNMLKKLRGGGAEAQTPLHLAAFGKHPGWDDHIPDLGLETERLVDVKRILYLEGIGGNIDSGAWDEGGERALLDRFNHVFIGFDRDDWVMGRMWSSTDGKGRTRYPMVVCAECRSLPLGWFGPVVFERLERLQSECVGADAAPDVTGGVRDARTELRGKIGAHAREAGGPVLSGNPLAALANAPEMGADHEGLVRLLYHIEREMPELRQLRGASKGSKTSSIDMGASERAHHLRVPRCNADPMRALALWRDFLHLTIAVGVARWVFVPLDGDWVELLVGPATAPALFCIRADRAGIPFVTEIPYQIDDEFRAPALQEIAEATGRSSA